MKRKLKLAALAILLYASAFWMIYDTLRMVRELYYAPIIVQSLI